MSILLYNFWGKHYFHIKTNVQNNVINQLYSSKIKNKKQMYTLWRDMEKFHGKTEDLKISRC